MNPDPRAEQQIRRGSDEETESQKRQQQIKMFEHGPVDDKRKRRNRGDARP